MKNSLKEKDENLRTFQQQIEFLEQTHLAKANFFSNKEKTYIKKMNDLQGYLDNILNKEAENKETLAERKQKWRLKEKQYLSTINLIKSNGEAEWLNVYNNLMEQINSLKKDVDHLKVEKEILTKRAKIQNAR